MSASQIAEHKANLKRYRSKITKAKNDLDFAVKTGKKPHCLPSHQHTFDCLEGDEHVKAATFVHYIYVWEDCVKTIVAKLATLENGGAK